MKKLVLFCAALPAVLMLGSCSQSDAIEPEIARNAVAFSSFVPQVTKGSVRTNAILQAADEGFEVVATYHENPWATLDDADKAPNFMYGQKVTWDGGSSSFTYSPIKFWPTNDHVSFFAFSPRSDKSITDGGIVKSPVDNGGNPTIFYQTPIKPADQIDLIAASSLDRTKDATYSGVGATDGKGSVYFDFKHILSKINFAAKLEQDDQEGVYFEITSLKFYVATADVYRARTYDLHAEAWNDAGIPEKFAVQDPSAVSSIHEAALRITSSTAWTTINASDKQVMLIPQVYDVDALKVRFGYKIMYDNPNTGSQDEVEAETFQELSLPIIKDGETNVGLEKGKSYLYTIALSRSGELITINEPTILEWDEVTPGVDVNI